MRQMIGETSGDIPLYSLHRIANLLRKRPIRLAVPFVSILNRSLIAANAVYRQESGNKWNCLTSHNLVDAIEHVDTKLAEIMTVEKLGRPEYIESDDEFREIIDEERKKYVKKIQKWFEENYDDLLYIMDGKIPWAIIRRLQQNLATWIAGVINPFSEDIGEMVLMVAKSEGVITDDPEMAWEAMGGRVFRKKEGEED
ncbi:MAG: hypothetical protein V1704_00380 [Candidatus Vogelbacteria bacterium]